MLKYTKLFFVFFLAVLLLSVNTVSFSNQWKCECDKHGELMSCCCNCPKCVDKRGGLLSYSQPCNNPYPSAEDENPLLKPASCTCGSGHVVSHLPIVVQFLTTQPSDHFIVVPICFFEIEDWILELDDFPADVDRPG